MSVSPIDPSSSPVWARDDAFPSAPAGWGWVSEKKDTFPCESLEALRTILREDRTGSVTLVWTPDNPRMVLPEELEGMGPALREAREIWTRNDLVDAQLRLRWLGAGLALFSAFAWLQGWMIAGQLAARSGITISFTQQFVFSLRTMFGSTQVGLAMLIFTIFGFIPWYQARKHRREMVTWTESNLAAAVPTLRFETWLGHQKAPVTRICLGLIAAVAIAQWFSKVPTEGWTSMISIFQTWRGIEEAGLVKSLVREGEWWRLLTAPFLHGNILHLLMNASALAYLGKRVEVFARWPHLPLIFLFSAVIGGEASARFVAAPSVGASGGLMGLLGFLLVFETLHEKLVPRRARRRLVAGVLLTGLIGIIGFRYIDNAAHIGGLIAGVAYGAIVFPSSASPHRPRSTSTDRIAGFAALAVMVVAALFAISRLAAH